MNFLIRKLLLFFLVHLGTGVAFAQEHRTCGTMDYMEKKKIHSPFSPNKSTSRSLPAIITIPVVVHILHNNSVQNINNAQILSQIQVLNEDFRRMNPDATNTLAAFLPFASDVEIEFCLANVDPNGFQTSGINRIPTDVTSFGVSDAIKSTVMGGQDAWNTADYLNIWVGAIGSGILGFAQFPGGNPATDGIVIDYRYFGTVGTATFPFDLGRTATHEVGHWLGLNHIWGDGGCSIDDGIADTPLAGNPNFVGLPCTASPNSCVETSGDLPDMFQNFMDYSDDGCMNLFTIGQRTVMRSLFEPNGARVSLLSSVGCTGNGIIATCFDGFQNGNEVGIDCGGNTCSDCSTFCNDEVQNGNELGVDCGGSCKACPPGPTEICTNAILLTMNGTYTAPGPSMGMGATNISADHANWYYFIPNTNGVVTINSCGGGVDTRIWVYEGCCSKLMSLETSDDDCELFSGGFNWASTINALPVFKGTRYYFEWDNRWSDSGFIFDFSFTPNNDDTMKNPTNCPDCPNDLINNTAPTIIITSESVCNADGLIEGGQIIAPNNSCPPNSSLVYSIDGETFSPEIPFYETENSITIFTRCDCNLDLTIYGITSSISTNPGNCPERIPTFSRWGVLIYGLLLMNLSMFFLYGLPERR